MVRENKAGPCNSKAVYYEVVLHTLQSYFNFINCLHILLPVIIFVAALSNYILVCATIYMMVLRDTNYFTIVHGIMSDYIVLLQMQTRIVYEPQSCEMFVLYDLKFKFQDFNKARDIIFHRGLHTFIVLLHYCVLQFVLNHITTYNTITCFRICY